MIAGSLLAAVLLLVSVASLLLIGGFFVAFVWPGNCCSLPQFEPGVVVEDALQSMQPRLAPQWAGEDYIIFPGVRNHGSELYLTSPAYGARIRRISADTKGEDDLDYAIDVSPDGSRIVYATTRHQTDRSHGLADYDLEIANRAGGDRKRLTANLQHDKFPRWSPDGESIAFINLGDPKYGSGVYLADADGDKFSLVFRYVSQLHQGWSYAPGRSGPVWSPDGKNIAVDATDANTGHSQVLLLLDTTEYRPKVIFRVPTLDPAIDHPNSFTPLGILYGEPAWSPDSRTLAFIYYRNHIHANVVAASGELAHPDGLPGMHEGWFIAFVGVDDGSVRGFRLDATFHWNSPYLNWSPDGRELLLTRHSAWQERSAWSSFFVIPPKLFLPERAHYRHIVALNVESGNVRVVSQGSYASWSPGGNRVAVAGKVDDIGGHLAIVNPDGSNLRIIVRADDNGELESIR